MRIFLAPTLLLVVAACSPKETPRADDFNFDGTCVRCHEGVTAGKTHPFKLRCVDCHGGNDQVEAVPENAHESESDYRNATWIEESHVRPKPGLARFFFANGIDDDGDGTIDEAPTFDNLGNITDLGEIAELGLQGQGVGEFVDAEFNRDLNYVRWLNPGDLRVATIGCGSGARTARDGNSGGACHQNVIESSRRSIMVNNAAVINGAYYGNESWRSEFQTARDANGAAFDPRAGAFGYVLNYEAIDSCIDASALDDDDTGRAQPVFDSACLEAKAGLSDPNAVAGAPGNVGLPAFEATQGSIDGPAPGVSATATMRHKGASQSRFQWGGHALKDPRASVARLSAMPDAELAPGVPDPVDMMLRGFRAYYPLNYVGSGNNLPFTFGESIVPGIQKFVTNNPFGRGHSSGCTACHMSYNSDGHRNGSDPTTKHREFDPETQDIVEAGGKTIIAGVTVNRAERLRAILGNDPDLTQEAPLAQRPQQKFYTADHAMTSQITTDQCGLCHAFVTRINFAYQGMAEDEQRDALARRKNIEFTTPAGTQVVIHDSWVREEALTGDPADRTVVIPSGDDIAKLAKSRNEDLNQEGLFPGWGGCAPNTFTEDCNNNGELDTALTLVRRNERGDILAQTTINEDLNGNGKLDLISHTPRENSVDGRQLRYVYGGANGAVRQMDIHFERGMHCIDCHMIQDVHGDGHLYSTNWDAIEIECEDCHGGLENATLTTSGPNGGNPLENARGHDGRPYFKRDGDTVVQRSRVTPGLAWKVPQVPTTAENPKAALAHSADHLPATVASGQHNVGSTFDGESGVSELADAKLECYSCHTSWIHNCLGCHYNVNTGDPVKKSIDAALAITDVPGENETWFNNKNQAGRTNFQLLEFMRSPFVLGVTAEADGGRLAPFRSSMQVHVSVTDAGRDTTLQNMTFTTFQKIDGNTQRQNVATSAAAMNQHMPHTVRKFETKDCDQCHSLVDTSGRIRNDHILAETYGLGTGRYSYAGDWALAAGAPQGALSGLEAFDYKQENQLLGSDPAQAVSRFPGITVNAGAGDRTAGAVEPLFNGALAGFQGTDVALVRNFNPAPATPGGTSAPTLKDLAVMTAQNGGAGRLVITDITLRGHPSATQPSAGTASHVAVVTLPGAANALAHLAPDISDPFVYVADGAAGLTTVEITDAPGGGGTVASVVDTVALPSSRTATEVALAGDLAYVGTEQGTIEVYDLIVPASPSHVVSVTAGDAVRGLALGGFHLYAATAGGVAIFEIGDPFDPVLPEGASDALALPIAGGAQELFFSEGRLFVAAGASGVLDIDVTVPAAPVNGGELAAAQNLVANDVIVSKVPGQTWLLVAQSNGDLAGIKLDNTKSTRERCLPDNDCGLDMDWRDFTIMGRDPSFDPNSQTFDATDPSGAPFFSIPGNQLSSARRLARPALWEKMGTHTGRRYRDSFMPGSGAMSLPVMKRMYDVLVCEVPGTADTSGNGLGDMGLFENGTCKAPDELSQGVSGPSFFSQFDQ